MTSLGPPAGEPYVVVKDVSHTYARRGSADLDVVSEINLTIAPGEFVILVGPSGCGKSTLLSIIAGLLRPTGGSVFVGSRPVVGPSDELGIVFQKPLLLDWRNALDNVLLQIEMRGLRRADYEEKARRLLSQVGLSGFERAMPRELSGGMEQRVGLCRALIHDPAFLLMDEPFAALDALTREQMAIDLQEIVLDTQVAVLFVTHSITEAVLLGDRIEVMSSRPGRIVKTICPRLTRPMSQDDMAMPEFGRACAEVRATLVEGGAFRRSGSSDQPRRRLT